MSDKKPPKPGCRDCPIDCRDQRGGKNKDKLGAYARLWFLEPDDPGLPGLVAEYHRLCNDIGLEAFETARAIALALQAGALAAGQAGIGAALKEVSLGTDLGRIIGSGSVAAAKYFGLADPGEGGPKKHGGSAPEEDALMDSLGLCAPAWPHLAGNSGAWAALAEMLRAKNGHDFKVEDLRDLGRRVIDLEEEWPRVAAKERKEDAEV